MIRGYRDEGTVSIGAFVAPAIKRSLVELAYQQHVTVSEVIRQAVREKVDRDLSPRERAT